MYILITKITTPLNHLVTLMGLPGVGKSSLIKATIQYIQDRSLLRGGLIFTDARSISNCELLVRKMNNQFISENSAMFGSAKEHNQS
jgi:predicted AAA+ superfamily ATPase